jgi:steroid 5-alpha reductase family enzyme
MDSGVMVAGLGIIIVMMTLLWVVSLLMKNAAIVDAFWGPGFAVVAIGYALLTPQDGGLRETILLILVSVWALRLGIYLGWRNLGKREDYRYANWRTQYGTNWWWRSLLQVYWLQGTLMWLIATPLYMVLSSTGSATLTVLDVLAIGLWLIGFSFEAIGDWQLIRFKANPANKGQVLRSGLWRYTRHPNYFGDAVVWWSYFVLALSVPWGWVSVFAPLMMTYLLRQVSGVTLLERNLQDSKPGYAEYVAQTNAFVPWWPRLKTPPKAATASMEQPI